MKCFQKSVALAAIVLVSTWSAASHADDEAPRQPGDTSGSGGTSQDDPSTSSATTTHTHPSATTSTGSTTSTTTSPPQGTTPSQPGTTTTTAAPYDPMVGAEQKEVTRRPNVRVLVPSALVFAGAYGTSAIAGAVNDRDSDRNLLIPVVGPWVALAERDCDANPCDNEGASVALLIASGILQTAGVAGVIASFFVPETTTRAAALKPSKPRLDFLPISVGRGAGAGFGAVGTF